MFEASLYLGKLLARLSPTENPEISKYGTLVQFSTQHFVVLNSSGQVKKKHLK